ncbi:MAG TPA: gas vesicle protein [Chloroflexota bacterium]|nr:gas vesicle protein [Chloroflexota bacterium]
MEQGERESGGGELAALDVSLLELVDHVLNRGVVLTGEAVIAVADVDLIYLGLDLVLSSVETAREAMARRSAALS